MRKVNISQVNIRLSRLVEDAAGGEEIVITKRGRPVVRLVALESSARPRKPGGWEGQVWMAEDFYAPLPKDLEDAFYGGDGGEPPAA